MKCDTFFLQNCTCIRNDFQIFTERLMDAFSTKHRLNDLTFSLRIAGRAGRVRDGTYFCMVSQDFYEKLLEFAEPDILVCSIYTCLEFSSYYFCLQKGPIHHTVLHVKALKLPAVWKPHDLFLQLLDSPTKETVDTAILQLKEVSSYFNGPNILCYNVKHTTHATVFHCFELNPSLLIRLFI